MRRLLPRTTAWPRQQPFSSSALQTLFLWCTLCWRVWSLGSAHKDGEIAKANGPLLNEQGFRDPVELETSGEGHTEELAYDASFPDFDRSILGARQNQDQTQVTNNERIQDEVRSGETKVYVFGASQVEGTPTRGNQSIPDTPGQTSSGSTRRQNSELKPRQNGNEVFVTLSVCRKPGSGGSSPPPDLQLFVSAAGNCSPGPTSDNQETIEAEEGFAKYTETRSGDVCFAVHAPEASGLDGSYSYELSASIDDPFTEYFAFSSLYLLDSDSESGLFITTNLTDREGRSEDDDEDSRKEWMDTNPPFSIFIHPRNSTAMSGLSRSYCGVDSNALVRGNVASNGNESVEVEMTEFSPARSNVTAKQRFYVPDLSPDSEYVAYLGLRSNYSGTEDNRPTAGGTLWRGINFRTKSQNNCQLLYDLPFCPHVAYSVPSNGTTTTAELREQYNDNTEAYMQNFTYSLAQIPCDTEPDAQYSLATTCANCTESYRLWLCAVTVPRCADWSSSAPWLQRRNILAPFLNGDPAPASNASERKAVFLNESRAGMIDDVIKPGPYKEVLPCGGLCHGLVQACPAAMGFSCPNVADYRANFDRSYGHEGAAGEYPRCNTPGAILSVGQGAALAPSFLLVVFGAGLATCLSMVGVVG